ncbi:MAG: 30S ribosomal protein S19e [Halobacteriales archaeon]|nr:30S ribosomal protein S19e [Halobacteriales archaeon]
MTTAHEVPGDRLVEETAEEVKELDAVEPPEWAEFAKTGRNRELPPENDDWWYVRTASILRKVYIEGPIGVSRLKKAYGGKDRKGVARSHHEEGSGSVIRTALQQLEEEGLVEQKGSDGRVVSSEGQKFLDGIASEVADEILAE